MVLNTHLLVLQVIESVCNHRRAGAGEHNFWNVIRPLTIVSTTDAASGGGTHLLALVVRRMTCARAPPTKACCSCCCMHWGCAHAPTMQQRQHTQTANSRSDLTALKTFLEMRKRHRIFQLSGSSPRTIVGGSEGVSNAPHGDALGPAPPFCCA